MEMTTLVWLTLKGVKACHDREACLGLLQAEQALLQEADLLRAAAPVRGLVQCLSQGNALAQLPPQRPLIARPLRPQLPYLPARQDCVDEPAR